MKNEYVHVHTMMLAAARYAGSRSKEDRALMLAVGSSFWSDFPAFLVEMKEAFRRAPGKDFLRQDDVKHMYALLFVSILNGLDSGYLNRIAGALLAAALPDKGSSARQAAPRNAAVLAPY